MTNLEYLKSLDDALDVAHIFCDLIGDVAEEKNNNGEPNDGGCDICPFSKKCYINHNFIQAYLVGEHK